MSDLASKLETFQHQGQSVPTYMHDGLLAYLEHGFRPGHFLTAVLSNDLRGAFEHADQENTANVGAYVAFLYNHADSRCWGSKEKVEKWIDTKFKMRQSSSSSVKGET